MNKNYITIPKESSLEKSQVRDRKMNKVLQRIPTDITELNKLIYVEAKLVSDKISIPLRNSKRNTKTGRGMMLRQSKGTATTTETT